MELLRERRPGGGDAHSKDPLKAARSLSCKTTTPRAASSAAGTRQSPTRRTRASMSPPGRARERQRKNLEPKWLDIALQRTGCTGVLDFGIPAIFWFAYYMIGFCTSIHRTCSPNIALLVQESKRCTFRLSAVSPRCGTSLWFAAHRSAQGLHNPGLSWQICPVLLFRVARVPAFVIMKSRLAFSSGPAHGSMMPYEKPVSSFARAVSHST